MAVQFYLFPRPSKSGEHPICISAYISNTRLQTTIGISVSPDHWLDARQCVKKATVNKKGLKANEINDKLLGITKAFNDFDMKKAGASVTKDELKALLQTTLYGAEHPKTTKPKVDFFKTFDEIITSEKVIRQWTESSVRKYNTVKKHLIAFSEDITFSDWTENRLNEYVNFLGTELRMKDVSVQKEIKLLKLVLKKAHKMGFSVPAAFLDFKPKFKIIDKEVVYLSWDELMTMYKFDIPEDGATIFLEDMNGRPYKKTVQNSSSMRKTRDLFCFCAFTGLRYSDMAKLKRTDISSDTIKVVTEKTNDSLTIPLNKYAKTILAKYEDETFPGDLALPVISNQKMNDYIKDLGEICGFTTPVNYIYYQGGMRHEEVYPKWSILGTHGARRTFICNALAFGISAEVIMKMTGHSNYAAMKPYIAISDATKKEAMEKFNKN